MSRFFIITLLLCSYLLWAKEKPDFIFPYWKNTYKINDKPFESEGHAAYIDIYVNDIAKKPYLEEASIFPVDSLIFKPLFSDKEGKYFARLVIMLKMKKGYDPENGDWWYGVYDASGTVNFHQGRIQSCIVCHKEGESTDYTFSESVNLEISRLADQAKFLKRQKALKTKQAN